MGSKKKSKNVKGKEKATTSKKDSNDELAAAIKALGGTDEDMELIENVDGGDEERTVDTHEEFSQKAQKELEAFIKNLGLDKSFKDAVIIPDEDVEMEDDEDEEEEEHPEDPQPASSPSPSKTHKASNIQDAEISSTTPEGGSTPANESEDEEENTEADQGFHFVKVTPKRNHCVVKTGLKWYEIAKLDVDEFPETTAYWIPKLEKYANSLLEKEVELHRAKPKLGAKKSEAQWISTVMRGGTLKDKFAAYVVLIQESPVHNLQTIETLIDMVSLKSRRPCLMAIDTLTELFRTDLLHPERKLRRFEQNPFRLLDQLSGGNKDTRDRYLVLWLFEHKLKMLYQKFLAGLDEVSKDTIENTKVKAMQTVLELLVANPEQEQELLSRLVNKLGDPLRRLAAKAMYQLEQLLHSHPAMKSVVVEDVERLLFRPNVNQKAQYYGICFLSRVLLGSDDQQLANHLIKVYFAFFKASVKKGEIETKLMSALLTGVNRAFPYAKVDAEKLNEQMETMYRIVHLSTFNVAIQAFQLIYQATDVAESANDRFFSSLYKKLIDPSLASSSKQALFLNLLFKSMKSDPVVNRVKAFLKRLLQICKYQSCQLICGFLFLISEVIKERPELGTFKTILEETDTNIEMMSKFEEDSDDEHYDDVKEDENEGDNDADEAETTQPKLSSWIHRKNIQGDHKTKSQYDPEHRNPLYAGAEHSLLWELDQLTDHFHPSVALFAKNLRESVPIKYSGDPLQDFTMIRFLDRFVFRNPKKDPTKGKPKSVLGKRKLYTPQGVKAIAPDSKEYVNRDESQIPDDEIFIHRYFKAKQEKKADDEDSDADSVTSEEFSNFMGNLTGADKLAEFEDEDIDFAEDVSKTKKSKKSKDEDDDDDLDDDDLDDEDIEDGDSEPELEGEGDEDIEWEDLDEAGSDDAEFDEEGFQVSDEDEQQDVPVPKKGKKQSKKEPSFELPLDKKKRKMKLDMNNLESLLASADDFADLLDADADGLDVGGSGAVSNKDKASVKQLKWEEKQANKGQKWKQKKQGFKGKQNFKQKKQKR